jgi:ElaB/YqjD/DUF883 family membrane-anchored ribosome-binding protein
MEHATEAARPITRALDTVTDRFTDRTTALGHRGADMIETAAGAVRARPVATVTTLAAVVVIVAGVASYLAYRSRR